MTFPTVLKKWLINSYGAARSTVAPKTITATSMCMMQWVKGSLPDSIITVNDLINYILRKITMQLTRKNGCVIVIACFDVATVPVKAIVEYEKRKEWSWAFFRPGNL